MFVVTGGGTGIGRAIALALASRGQSVMIVGRREEPLQTTAALSDRIDYLIADVALPEGREHILSSLNAQPSLRGLINNAGTIEPILPIASLQLQDWRNTLAVNLEAPLFLTQRLLSKLKQGRVLNIGSGAAYFPVQGWTAYCVSKAALSMLTRSWQLESQDTAFASVMPGITDTDMQAYIRQASFMDPEKLAFFQSLHQSHRLVSAELVGKFAAWMLLDTPAAEFTAREWDIYDQSHHQQWLGEGEQVPGWEE